MCGWGGGVIRVMLVVSRWLLRGLTISNDAYNGKSRHIRIDARDDCKYGLTLDQCEARAALEFKNFKGKKQKH